jgi:hypothetical protein
VGLVSGADYGKLRKDVLEKHEEAPKKKKKKKVNLKTLSFGDEEEELSAEPPTKFAKMGKDKAVKTDFLPDKDKEVPPTLPMKPLAPRELRSP